MFTGGCNSCTECGYTKCNWYSFSTNRGLKF
jgi:hypothetical protein